MSLNPPTIIKKVQIGNHKLGSRYFGFFFPRKLHEYQWQSKNILQIVPRVFNIIFEMKLPGNVLAKEIKLKNGFYILLTKIWFFCHLILDKRYKSMHAFFVEI